MARGGSAGSDGAAARPTTVRLERLLHLLTVPVRLGGGVESRFVVDTGIGVNLVTRELASRVGWTPSGSGYTGRRMSGQEVRVALGTLPSLAVGSVLWSDATFGEIDTSGFPPELRTIGGFLSLGLFERHRLVLAPRSGEMRIGGGPEPRLLAEVPADYVRDGPSVSVFLDLRLPSGTEARVEVDTGSDALILDERYMAELGVRADDPALRRNEGTDETGHRFVRWACRLDGELALARAPKVRAPAGATIFQRVIYDGLLGAGFLDRFDVGYDLARGTMSFSDPLSG